MTGDIQSQDQVSGGIAGPRTTCPGGHLVRGGTAGPPTPAVPGLSRDYLSPQQPCVRVSQNAKVTPAVPGLYRNNLTHGSWGLGSPWMIPGLPFLAWCMQCVRGRRLSQDDPMWSADCQRNLRLSKDDRETEHGTTGQPTVTTTSAL